MSPWRDRAGNRGVDWREGLAGPPGGGDRRQGRPHGVVARGSVQIVSPASHCKVKEEMCLYLGTDVPGSRSKLV
jgi:hypothetical protein